MIGLKTCVLCSDSPVDQISFNQHLIHQIKVKNYDKVLNGRPMLSDFITTFIV